MMLDDTELVKFAVGESYVDLSQSDGMVCPVSLPHAPAIHLSTPLRCKQAMPTYAECLAQPNPFPFETELIHWMLLQPVNISSEWLKRLKPM